jgi:glucan phosphoethanolaminetransferase (alkaline phosphatase superfamily)
VPVIIGLIFATFYGFSKLVSLGPAETIFGLLLLTVPSAIFITVYSIFIRRTKKFPKPIIRILSWIVFAAGLCFCVTYLFLDMKQFFTVRSLEITNYRSFSILFLAGNIATLFLIAIIQAFSRDKEKDWTERHKK